MNFFKYMQIMTTSRASKLSNDDQIFKFYPNDLEILFKKCKEVQILWNTVYVPLTVNYSNWFVYLPKISRE